MEDCIESRKRVRDDSDDSSSNDVLEAKIVRVDDTIDSDFISPVDSITLDAKLMRSEQNRVHGGDSISVLDSLEANAVHEDLLKILDEADASMDRDSAILGLDLVIRSFEEEIHVPANVEPASVSDLSQPELGYLLEASDDELGLPPSASSSGSEIEKAEAFDFLTHYASSSSAKGFLGLEGDVPSYCWIESFSSEYESNDSEEVALSGLFDHTDVTVEFPCRSETMFCS